MKKAVILLILLCLGYHMSGQEDTTSLNRKRLNLLIMGGSVIYVGTMAGLYQAWYKDYPHSGFHFTNDGREWEGLDKLGHVTTSYWIGRISYHSLRWAGVKEKHAVWYGGSMGLLFLTTVEIMDGFSEEWGASMGDFAANMAGAGMFIGQQLLWQEQRFLIKYSYHPTDFAQYRPDVLGSTCIERMLKDYNGQTYWLSGNIHAFLREESRFPRWFNVALGYGATGMTGGSENVDSYKDEPVPEFTRTRQYFLSLDVDLTKIRTRSKFLKGVFTLLGFIKIPMPALEYTSEGKLVFHYLYF